MILNKCKTEGNIASMDSLAPLVEPGKAITNVSPINPPMLLDNIEYGIRFCPYCLKCSPIPGISRFNNG